MTQAPVARLLSLWRSPGVRHVGLDQPRITQAVQALRAERVGDVPERAALTQLVEELDRAAFDAEDSEADSDCAFRQARAATALLAVFEDDSGEAVAHATYEAYHAVDEDMSLLRQAIGTAL